MEERRRKAVWASASLVFVTGELFHDDHGRDDHDDQCGDGDVDAYAYSLEDDEDDENM